MFKRRRGISLIKFIGIVIFIIGLGIFLYMMPFKLWIFIFALICMAVGILIYNY